MPPARAKPGVHQNFDIGVAGRRTGVQPPSNVRRDSEGFEDIDAYYASSPHKRGASSPQKSTAGSSARKSVAGSSSRAQVLVPPPSSVSREKRNRPDLYHEIGELGRKTGIAAPKNVTRDSGGFERFEDFLTSLSPEASRTARSNRAAASVTRRPVQRHDNEDEDEDDYGGFPDPDADDGGTMAMSIVDGDTGPSPRTYLSRASAGGSASKSRSLSALNDSARSQRFYDAGDISPPSARRSKGKGRAVPEGEDEEQDHQMEEMDYVGGGPADEEEEVIIEEYPEEGYAGDGGYDDDPDDTFAQVNGAGRGNASGRGHDLEDIVEEDEDEDEEDENARGRKTAVAKETKKKIVRERDPSPPGVRRSGRQRVKTLDFWRGERVVYRRRVSSGAHGGPPGVAVLSMTGVDLKPVEPAAPLAAKKRYGSVKPTSGGGRFKTESSVPPEEGMDSKTSPEGTVWNWETNDEIKRRVAFTSQMVETKPYLLSQGKGPKGELYDEAPFVFQKVFSELDYMAGGLLIIPKGRGKPLKPSKDNSYMFYVLEGAVKVTVHRTAFIVAPNGMFLIPRGNLYAIKNEADRPAKLFFVQARRTPVDETTIAEASQTAKVLARARGPAEEEEEDRPKKKAAKSSPKGKGKARAVVQEEEEDEEEEEQEEEDEEEDEPPRRRVSGGKAKKATTASLRGKARR